MADASTTRTIHQQIEIDAAPDDVWTAIATGDGVARWFGFEARVDPAVGGDYFVSWGPECEGTWRIEAWEPPRRLILSDNEFVPGLPQTVEYLLEGRGGRTVLRMTHSGIGRDDAWDEMYDSMSRGWEVFMRTLRHGLTRHRGVDRRVARAQRKVERPREEVWANLLGPSGLDATRDDDAGTFALHRDPSLEGTLWVWNPPKDLAGTVAGLDDAALWIALEGSDDGPVSIDMTLSGFGVADAPLRAVERRWRAMLEHLFPAANGD